MCGTSVFSVHPPHYYGETAFLSRLLFLLTRTQNHCHQTVNIQIAGVAFFLEGLRL